MIFDLGTATTVSVIDEKKNYIGGMIYPGVNISLNALTENASQLQGIGLEAPKRIVGKNTIECMKSGVLYSSAAAIDGIIDRIEEAIGQPMTAIATGGLSKKIVPYCKREVILDDDLLLKGLLIIYMGRVHAYLIPEQASAACKEQFLEMIRTNLPAERRKKI